MKTDPLIIPRRLAIEILHEAQIAQPQAIRGWVSARNGNAEFYAHGEPPPGAAVWARLWSYPFAPPLAVPRADELAAGGVHLLAALNTRGVLQLRAWQLAGSTPVERVLLVRD